MYFALKRVRPRAVVLLETELWPGLLLACAVLRIPVVMLNARMSSRSLPGYLALRPLLRPPERIGAISIQDARRFDLVFGPGRTRVTGNMKFDRAMNMPLLTRQENPLAHLIPENIWFVVLGSVREEEEGAVLALISALREQRPQCVVGLFPRHMHRVAAWTERLSAARTPFVLRSNAAGPVPLGTVIVWDHFGELNAAYALADRAFVGGSLARLGGQNFLEPLSQGVLPVVGPHTRNFDWVGQEIFAGLVHKSADITVLARKLAAPAPPRQEVRRQAEAYIAARQGATKASVEIVKPFFT
jgi:3-deoxy-D-manno-octulosonic-acid transferase